MTELQALLLGLIQGLTEFLPVSSSGHLIMGKELLGIQVNPGAETTFEVLVHAATVLSTLVIFRKDIAKLVAGIFQFKYNDETQYVLKIGVSMIPVLIVGLFFKNQVEALFGQGIVLVGSMLLVTALLLTLSYFKKSGDRPIGYLDAFIIGLAQAVAVLPGLSRSGATISTGLLIGNRRNDVAKFSFLMVLVPIMGEAFMELLKGEFTPAASGISTPSLIIGFLGAFVSGLFACKIMIEMVKHSKLIYFGIYCLIIGLIAIFAGLF
ncbi:MAG: undecaprenyl-diphosphate phosphatase [Prolixibacteraceae bacterium]|nr:undecaprenyl-diphosphate phosphatase [Prolixibacteraceae bacterium]